MITITIPDIKPINNMFFSLYLIDLGIMSSKDKVIIKPATIAAKMITILPGVTPSVTMEKTVINIPDIRITRVT